VGIEVGWGVVRVGMKGMLVGSREGRLGVNGWQIGLGWVDSGVASGGLVVGDTAALVGLGMW